jgi:hypothetical protein
MSAITIPTTRIPPSTGFFGEIYTWIAQKIHRWLISHFFPNFHNPITPALQERHGAAMIGYGNWAPLSIPQHPGIDALYVPANGHHRTGHVIVMCFNGPYQMANPEKHWKLFWAAGADIVLWNPTQIDGPQMATELEALLGTLRTANPNQIITVKTSCAGSAAAIQAVESRHDPRIHLILDRAFGCAEQVVRSVTILAKLPIVRTILQNHFVCSGLSRIGNIAGQTLILEAEHDQILGRERHSHALYQRADSSRRDHYLMRGLDHWAAWDSPTCDKVIDSLRKWSVISNQPVDTTSFIRPKYSFFYTYIFPYLIRAWI